MMYWPNLLQVKPASFVPAMWKEWIRRTTSVFSLLEKVGVTRQLQRQTSHIRDSHVKFNNLKICVKPNDAGNSAIAWCYYHPTTALTTTYYDQVTPHCHVALLSIAF